MGRLQGNDKGENMSDKRYCVNCHKFIDDDNEAIYCIGCHVEIGCEYCIDSQHLPTTDDDVFCDYECKESAGVNYE